MQLLRKILGLKTEQGKNLFENVRFNAWVLIVHIRRLMRARTREIIRQTCAEMGVHIIKGVLARDHVHMFIDLPPKLALSAVMQCIKSRSSRRVQMEFPELRKRYWGRRSDHLKLKRVGWSFTGPPKPSSQSFQAKV